jgi:hypothetical protein
MFGLSEGTSFLQIGQRTVVGMRDPRVRYLYYPITASAADLEFAGRIGNKFAARSGS